MSKLDLINYRELSFLLTGNKGSIRRGKYSKKYAAAVEELEELVELWHDKHILNTSAEKIIPKELIVLAKSMIEVMDKYKPMTVTEVVEEVCTTKRCGLGKYRPKNKGKKCKVE